MDLAKLIDHTQLKPSAVLSDIDNAIRVGIDYKVASVCVYPVWVRHVAEALVNTEVKCCSVAGFPTGANHPKVILQEVAQAVYDGADEIDMVMNLGYARMGNWCEISNEIKSIKNEIGSKILKVILEICELSDEEILIASQVAMDSGADFIKTSTGFGQHGATLESVKLMASITQGKIGIKAAGGIRTLSDMQSFINAGASRIGTSSTVNILNEAAKNNDENEKKNQIVLT
ncbi:MAG: deoxyribose-phosphate aldolase [Candidatus Electryonea clarkiae]|nr:deoxyribose-phosphate aldolase [Candidatus Electryonea clarkiae]MDP8287075.1 deoxyribose-phosphate aldolase [Candidatus Electryonea clarkiae]